MNESDFCEFTELLDATCALITRGTYVPNAANAALFFRAMRAHSIETVRGALDAHTKDPQRGKFAPVPADLIAQITQITADDGRPGPEEAWAIALPARDEAATVVWTDEIASAWGICSPIMQAGDEVGARMAFKEAYARLVVEARKGLKPAVWSPSLGHDSSQHAIALEQAASLGRIAAPELLKLPPPDEAMQRIADNPKCPPDVLAKLLALREKLVSAPQHADDDSTIIGDFRPIPREELPPGMRGAAK